MWNFASKFADKVVRLRHGKLDRIELLDQSTMKHNLGFQDKILDRNPNKSASQRYRPQMALFGYRWIIKVAEWVAKAGLEPREIANARL